MSFCVACPFIMQTPVFMLVWPRARVFCSDKGFARWVSVAEHWYSEWMEGAHLADGMRASAKAGTFAVMQHHTGVHSIRMRFAQIEIILEVFPCPKMLTAVRTVQRAFRRRILIRQRARRLALGMAWHARLGCDSALQGLPTDVGAVIAGFV